MPVSRQTSPLDIWQHALSSPALTLSGKHGTCCGARSPLTKKHVLEFVLAPRAEAAVAIIKAIDCESIEVRILRGEWSCEKIRDRSQRP